MSYRDSPNYQEAQRRAALQKKSKTEYGRWWHHRELIKALKALINEKRSAPAGDSSDEGEALRRRG